ncbi:MAG: FAD-dependent oxidoreductase, partial [Alphaproteobacteria bacterium]
MPAHAKFTNLPNRRTGQTKPDRPRVVILGAGFGGLSAARALSRCPADITIVERRNYHLFQPFL